jgi:hypothetical protein
VRLSAQHAQGDAAWRWIVNEPPRCTERNIGMKSNRCALPKNHKGACRAPRTGDRIRWKKLGIYEKEWPK